jgi:hypothetical protein
MAISCRIRSIALVACSAIVPSLIAVIPAQAVSAKSAGEGINAGRGIQAATTTTTWWYIQNEHTGRCVDDSVPYGLRSFTCNSLDYQGWYQVHVSGNVYAFQNMHTGRCIDDSAPYGLRSFTCNGLDYQQWSILPGSSFVLRNVHTGLCMDDSAAYGLRAIGCNGLDYQRWI